MENQNIDIVENKSSNQAWENIFNESSDSRTMIWFCEFSFPVSIDSDTNKPDLEGTELGLVRDVIASSTKQGILDFLYNGVINNEMICERVNFTPSGDYQKDLTEFFSAPGRNLYISLVPLI